jgi:hypothetical protein
VGTSTCLNLSPHGILSVGKNERTNGRRAISGKYNSTCSLNWTFSSQFPPKKMPRGSNCDEQNGYLRVMVRFKKPLEKNFLGRPHGRHAVISRNSVTLWLAFPRQIGHLARDQAGTHIADTGAHPPDLCDSMSLAVHQKGGHFRRLESFSLTPPGFRERAATSGCRAALCCRPQSGIYRQHRAISFWLTQRYATRREPGSRRVALTGDFCCLDRLERLRDPDHLTGDSLPKWPSVF